jgi:hypothetical protein
LFEVEKIHEVNIVIEQKISVNDWPSVLHTFPIYIISLYCMYYTEVCMYVYMYVYMYMYVLYVCMYVCKCESRRKGSNENNWND